MMNIVIIEAIAENYRKKVEKRRITSGERRILSLRKEEERLNGQTP